MNSSLNAVYRVVWNAAKGVWQAVSEIGKACGKGKTFRALKLVNNSALLMAVAVSPVAMAQGLPTNGSVVAGQASISQSGNQMTVKQTSDRAAIDWQSFNVGQGKSVDFVQPTSQSVALNRVLGSDVSVIQGRINANGQVFFVNPNGILFTPDAQVNTSGLVASTQNISTADFIAGKYTFSGNSRAAVTNQGKITAAPGGTVALIAAKIINAGQITADKGNVLMGAGNTVVLDLGGPVKIQVKEGALNAAIEQSGGIRANGGLVYLTAKAAGDLASTVINHTGITQAQTLTTGEKGEIYLMGGMENDAIQVSGTLDASAPQKGDGGFIETSAATVKLNKPHTVTTKASQGKTGTWLIDPNDYTIAATNGNITGAQLGTNLASNNVTISTSNQGTAGGNGDIFVKDNVSWSSGNTLTLNAERNIKINATLDASQGSGGKVALNYGQGAVAAGNTANYDFGLTNTGFSGKINLQAGNNFSTQRGSDGTPINYTVITSLGAPGSLTGTDLQGINGNQDGNYALGANINAVDTERWNNGAGFEPIGFYSDTGFNGRFNGLGHTINDININRPQSDAIGLFGIAVESTIENIGIKGGFIRGNTDTGGLVGSNSYGNISQAYTTGDVISGGNAGGLVGNNDSGNISQSYATGNVTSGSGNAGGLVGYNLSGNISQAYATGDVTSGGRNAGGLIGYASSGSIDQAYATGAVKSSIYAGGLVGTIDEPMTINNSYAIGFIGPVMSGMGLAGGLVGNAALDTSINNSFWDTQSTGKSIGVGNNTATGNSTGKTTAEMKNIATFNAAGWDIAGSGGAYPTLTFGSSATTWQIGSLATPVAYTLSDKTFTYKAGAYNLADLWSSGSIFGDTYSSWVLGTDYNFSYGGNTVTSFTNAGAYNSIGVTVLKTGFAAASTGNTLGSLTIDKAILTGVTGITAENKTYNGSTAATLNLNNVSFSGLLGSDRLSLTNATGTFDNANAGTNKTVTVSNLVLGGNPADNYQFSNGYTTSTTANIDKKALTISDSLVANKTYDGTTTAAVTAGTLNGLISGESLGTTNATGTFENKNASNSKNVTAVYTLTDGTTALASNYSLPNETLTANILPAALTVVSNDFVSSNSATPTIVSQTGCVDSTNCVSITFNNDNLGLNFASDQLASNYTAKLIIPGERDADLTVARNITFNGFNLTLRADKNINIRSTIDATGGNGGQVSLEYGQNAVFSASNTASYNFGLTASGFSGKINLQTGNNLFMKLGNDGTTVQYFIINALGAQEDATTVPATLTLQGLEGLTNSNGLTGRYALGTDINASDTVNWNNGQGFTPIGNNTKIFSSRLDGLGHTISNLTINRPDRDYVGLIGRSDMFAQNIGLTNANIIGANNVGAVAGRIALLRNTYATGSVLGNYRVGGLAGWVASSVSDAYATSNVTGRSRIGGLIGDTNAITRSYATGNVTNNIAEANDSLVGGLAGVTFGSVSQSYATGDVTVRSIASNNDNIVGIGGLVGIALGNVDQSYATGDVIGFNRVGGLIGEAQPASTVTRSYATGDVTGRDMVGGLIGNANSVINQVYASGDVIGTNKVGGLIGFLNNNISLAYATGDVTTTANTNATYVGGLIGGINAYSRTINLSDLYATGDVIANNAEGVGGLIGAVMIINGINFQSNLTRAYASGAVINDNAFTGGLVGFNGPLSDESPALIISNSFWDTQTTGKTTSAGVGAIGKTTAEMQNPFTFIDAGWDFINTWGLSTSGANSGYMQLRNFATGLYDDYIQVGDASKTYGDANSSISGAALSGLGHENVTVGWGSAITATSNAGTYDYSTPNLLNVSNNVTGRSTYVDTSSGQLTIEQKALTLTANNVQKTYDGSTQYAAQASDLLALSQQCLKIISALLSKLTRLYT